jgi:hypothetical protein
MTSFRPLIFSFLATVVCVQLVASADSCALFWPSVRPGDNNTINDECTLWPGFPRMFGTTSVFAAYTRYWEGDLSVLDPILNAALDRSFATFVPLVTTNGNYIPNIVIIFSSEIDDETIAGTTLPTLTGPCQIQIFDLIAPLMNTSPKQASQAIAHEIYHCIQNANLGDVEAGATDWVIEGSADYFSNLAFPDANLEQEEEVGYVPTSPIYQQDYKTSLFFQTMEWSKGAPYIHKWVMDTVFEASPATTNEERARLANLPGFLSDFNLFAQEFSVHSPFSSALSSILDTDGEYIDIYNPIEPIPVTLTLNNDEGTSGTVDLRAVPFTITVFYLPIDPGQIIEISAAVFPSDRVSYRLQKDSIWANVPDFTGEGAAGFIVTECDDPDTLYILYVSGADVDSSSVSIFIKQFYKDNSETCKCKTSGGGPGLQDCKPTTSIPTTASSLTTTTTTPASTSGLTGSAPAPTATGSCKSSTFPTDSCLTGNTWNLDLVAMKTLMEEKLRNQPASTLTSLSGSGTLTINGTEADFVYNNMQIDITIKDVGPVTTVVNGNFQASIFIQSGGTGSGNLCLAAARGEGTAVISNPLTGETSIDLGTPDGWISPDWEIQYTCSDGKLSMQGFANGVGAWGPYAYTS